jgi:hypothetical protein
MQTRYHVQRGDTRTTVSLDKTLSALLALKIGHDPETTDAHAAVRQWLQARLDDQADPDRRSVSQWLTQESILFVTDKKLSEKYLIWLTGI